MLTQAMEKLNKRDCQILRKYFWHKETQEEIAEDLGVSRVMVAKIIKKSLTFLRCEVTKYAKKSRI